MKNPTILNSCSAPENCGNWQLCHPVLLANPFDVPAFCEKLALSVTQEFDDNRGFFLRQPCYRNFVNTLDAF